MYILTKEQYKTGKKAIDWILNNVNEADIPRELLKGTRDYIAAGNAHEAADIDRVLELLNENTAELVKAVRDILEDGKVTLSDLADGFTLFGILKDITDDYPEIKEELLNLNKLEIQLLSIELVEAIKKYL